MTDTTVKLRIEGDNGSLVATVRASKAEVASLGAAAVSAGTQAQAGARGVDQVTRAASGTVAAARASKVEVAGLGASAVTAGTQAQAGARGVDRFGDAAERTRKQGGLLSGTLGQLKGLLAGYAGLQGIREMGRAADTYSDIVGKLSQVTKGERELAQAKAETFRIAQQTYQSLDATVTLYSRSAQALQQYGVSQGKVAQLTQTINQGLLISRATTAESASAILQLSQAMGAGALRGEEFNAVNEAAPRLMQALAESMGVPRGALKKLAEEGKLTVAEMLKAWTGPNAKKFAEEAAKVPLTMSRAWQQAKNDTLRYIGEINEASGASAGLASGIAALGKNIDSLAQAGVALAIVFGGRVVGAFVAARMAKALQAVESIKAANAELRQARAADQVAQANLRVAQTSKFLLNDTRGLAESQLRAAAASQRLNTAQAAAPGIMARVGTGVAGLGRGMLAFVGGPIGALLIALGLVIGKLMQAKAQADAARGSFAAAAGNAAAARESMDAAALQASGVELLGRKQQLLSDKEELERIAASKMGYAGTKFGKYVSATDARELLRTTKNDLAATQRELDLNRELIERNQGRWSKPAVEPEIVIPGEEKKDKKTKDKAADELKRRLEFQREFREELVRLRAEQEGPLKVAEVERTQRIDEVGRLLKEGSITQADYNEAVDAASVAYAKAASEAQKDAEALRQRQDIMGKVHAEMEQEIRLSGLSAQARRIEEAMVRAVNDARQEGKPLAEQEIADLREYMTWADQVIQFNQEQARFAEEFSGVWHQAINSVADAFGGFVASGFRDVRGLLDSLKQAFQRWLSDLVSMFARAGFSKMMSGLVDGFAGASGGGGGGAGGGFWTQAGKMMMQYFGGGSGGFASAGSTGGGGMWGNLLKQYAPQIAGYLGLGGSAAAAAGAWGAGLGTGFGSISGVASGAFGAFGASSPAWVGGTAAGAAGAGGAGAAGAGGASAAGAGVMAVAGWAAAILAGMYMGSQWYKQGWNLKDGEVKKVTPGAHIVSFTDKVWQKLGANEKWAAILSGSSGVARMFGLRAPEITGQGISGNIGFGGFDGNSYADIKRKGGWFRSDKKWTEYGEVSNGIDRAFDSVSMAVATRANGLAADLGIDITRALSTVRFDIGKIQLDADPEKAREQIQKKMEQVADQLTTAAVEALGFKHLLDDGFHSGEVMTALAASIELVTGSAKDLGRALTDFEKGNITKAVEYFESLALKNGTSLSDEISRTLGLLQNYSSLMGEVTSKLKMSGLNEYQRAQLNIELEYRGQVKQANELAKALGLSGARAEDLAKIEQLRAVNMAQLQKQMESQRDGFLDELNLSELSPLRDDQKLTESMRMLRDATAAGDLQKAQQYAQSALGFGRNLYASGADYNALYGEVTGLVKGIANSSMTGLTDTTLREIADGIINLPDELGKVMFALAAGINPTPPPVLNIPATPPGFNNGPAGTDATVLGNIERLLSVIAANSTKSAQSAGLSALNGHLVAHQVL